MLIAREPNYLYLTIGLLAGVVLATSAREQISFARAGVLVAAITLQLRGRARKLHQREMKKTI